MAALTDLSDLVNRMSGGNSGNPQSIFINKVGRIAGAAAPSGQTGRPASLWRYDSTHGPGAAPSSGAIPTRTTEGAIPIATVGSGRERWLIQSWATANTPGTLMLYDRLYHIGGLSGTSTSSQMVQGASPSPAITRNTGGEGNIALFEVYTTIGTTLTTVTMTYVNQSGTGSRTGSTAIGSGTHNYVGCARVIPLQAGDTGVRSVTSVQLTTTTGTVGDWGITIARPLAYIPIHSSGAPGWRDFTVGMPSLPKIDDDACLAWLWIPVSNTVASDIFCAISTVDK